MVIRSTPFASRICSAPPSTENVTRARAIIDIGSLSITSVTAGGAATVSVLIRSGLRVLMGQLFPRNPYVRDEVTSRLFVGELDEVALYDRVLSEMDIVKHHQLARRDAEPTAQSSADSH